LEDRKEDLFTIYGFGTLFLFFSAVMFAGSGWSLGGVLVALSFCVLGAVFLYSGYKWQKKLKRNP
jgi:hypothetical protein